MAALRRKSDVRRNGAALRSAQSLRGVSALRVRLESGEVVTCNRSEELRVPTDPEERRQAVREAPAQYDFWAYQTELALRAVREQELVVSQTEARYYMLYRTYFTDTEGIDPTERMIQARIDYDRDVRKERVALKDRRSQYGLLRSMRDAVVYRLRALGLTDKGKYASESR